jgi:hypothetical protein
MDKIYLVEIPDMINKEHAALVCCLSGYAKITDSWQRRDFCFNDIPKDWLRKVPQKSPFQEWAPSRLNKDPESWFSARSGWNAAIGAVLSMETRTREDDGVLVEVAGYVKTEEIKKMREP